MLKWVHFPSLQKCLITQLKQVIYPQTRPRLLSTKKQQKKMVFTFVQFCFPLGLLRLANTFQVKHDHQQTRLGWQNSVKLQQQCHFVAPCKNLNRCYFTKKFCQTFKRIGNINIHYKNRRKQMCNGSWIRSSLQFH